MVKGKPTVHYIANICRRWYGMAEERKKTTENCFKTLSAKHSCAYSVMLGFVAVLYRVCQPDPLNNPGFHPTH